MGYHRAGFDVVGVDIKPQPRFPFAFIQADALQFAADHARYYDLVHASPPCQGYSRLRHLPWLKEKEWPMLIGETRAALVASGRPWIIENVEGAPLPNSFVLCGQMFCLPVYRHRRFEASHFILAPDHEKHVSVIGSGARVNDRRKGSLNNGSRRGAWGHSRIVTVAGGQFLKADGERALGIHWMHKSELAQAIPPAYTEYVGAQMLQVLA